MEKRITSVQWSASNLPAGLSFDTATGTFSGTPSEAGDYTVPVSVKTNYGENAKDIKISVAEGVKAYPVYAIGSYAAKWSSNAEADENGFRKLEIPKAYQLCQHYLGFGAKTSGDKYYYCGIKGVSSDLGILASANYTCLKYFSTTNTPEVLDGVQQVQAGIAQRKSSDYTYSNFLKNFSEVSYILKRYTSGKVTFKNCNVQTHGTYNGSNVMRCETKSSAEKTFDNGILLNENSFDYIWTDEIKAVPIVRYNSEHGFYVYPQALSDLGGTGNATIYGGYYQNALSKSQRDEIKQKVQDKILYNATYLDFKPLKRFSCLASSLYQYTGSTCKKTMSVQYPIFTFLTEDKLLDNNPNNFTSGEISDAWVIGKTAYVATEDNKLYLYNNSSLSWDFVGNYNIKKIEFAPFNPSDATIGVINTEIIGMPNIIFMLTNDGKLYHKGLAVTDVTEEHGEFTQIFPDCYFYDFTFGSNTLTVLKN